MTNKETTTYLLTWLTLYLVTSANLKHILLSDVILRRTAFSLKSLHSVQSISELRGATQIWCHLILLAARHKRAHPAWTPASEGCYSIYLPRRDGRLSWPRCLITPGLGIEPMTAGSEVGRPNHCATETPESAYPAPIKRPDCLLRLWRHINLLLTYLLTNSRVLSIPQGQQWPPQVISTGSCQRIWPTYAVIAWLTKTRTGALLWLV